MKKKILASLLTAILSTLAINSTLACTDFRVSAKDGTLLIARSLEFGTPLNSNLRTMIRDKAFNTTTPDNKPGMSWKVKYGYVYVDGFNQDMALDGLNEMGLTFEALYLPGETEYQSIPAGKEGRGVSYLHVGDWILGNFKTIDEVKSALSNVYVFGQALPELGILPMHFAVYDASGKGIVVEFVGGKTMIHDSIGVMTNSPTYDWHVTNLRNYLNLTPYNPTPVSTAGVTFSATGQGAGMVGLPGDVSPPSRFVKIAFMMKNVYPANDAASALNLAQHVMNNVDIPAGLARTTSNGTDSSDTTQWVVFKDITHKVIYYHTYNDLTLRQVSFSALNFAANAPQLVMPLADAPYVMDVTTKFTQSAKH